MPRGWRTVRIGGAVSIILFATLMPTADRTRGFVWFSGLADALCNLALFLPLGMALYRPDRHGKSAVLFAALLSATVEVLQVFIPGRHSSPADVVCNAAGAAMGWWLAARWGLLLDPGPREARRFGFMAGLGALMVLAGTLLLFRYAPSGDDYFAQWTPELGYIAHYDGRIVRAELDGASEPDGRIADKARVDEFVRGGRRLHLSLLAAPPPDELSDVISVAGSEKEIVLVAAEGNDLLLRYRTLGRVLTLNRPLIRVPGVLATVTPGAPADIEIVRQRGWCVRVSGSGQTCGHGYTAGDGWRLFQTPRLAPWLLATLNVCWLVALMTPLGYWADARVALVFGLAATAGLYGLTAALREPAVPVHEMLAVLLGWSAGPLLWRLRQPRKASLATSSRQRSIRS
jgi:VanZ family protein